MPKKKADGFRDRIRQDEIKAMEKHAKASKIESSETPIRPTPKAPKPPKKLKSLREQVDEMNSQAEGRFRKK